MVDKEKCVNKAIQLGTVNYSKYNNCAQATFTAIIDALKEEGITITSAEAEEAIFNSLAGVSGGHANMGTGNCGALTGAVAAISLASNVSRAMQLTDKENRWIAFDNVAKTVVIRFKNEFYGLTCRDVTWKRNGKIWDIWDPEANENFLFEKKKLDPAANCIVSMIAGWGTDYVIEALENPRTLEQIKKDHNLV